MPGPDQGPTRVVHVALFTDSYGSAHTGVTVAVQLLRKHLISSRQKVTVIAPAESLATERTDVGDDVEVLLSSFRLPGVYPRLAVGLGFRFCMRDLRRTKPDVVHVHGFGAISLLGIHFAQQTNTPLVITWHTDLRSYVEHYRYLSRFLSVGTVLARLVCRGKAVKPLNGQSPADRFIATLVAAADLVIAPSEKIAKRLRELPVDTLIVTVPVGVDPIRPSPFPQTSLPEMDGPMLLYVGRLAPEKGIDLLLDAFEIVVRERPDATLVLAGDHSCSRELKKRLRVARQFNVVLTGALERGTLACLYARADLFVFPSLTDTQGLVLQEAAHAGLPLVVVDSELRSPVIDDNIATCCMPAPHALAAAIQRTLELGQDERWSARVRSIAKEVAARHSSDRHCRTVAALYRLYEGGRL